MDRVVLHSDCNSFYASVECLYHPELRGRAMAVGGSVQQRHGIILAKNQLAKRCGVSTGEALWQARAKCPDLVVLPPRFPLYLRFSKAVREIYLQYTQQVEPFGLDEAWLDVSGSVSSPQQGVRLANEIRGRVREELGLTVSVGVSWNKIFAKLGSDYKKPDATTAFLRDNWRALVWPLPVENLLYVGQATARKLRDCGVHSIGQLAQAPLPALRSKLGKAGETLWAYANGMDVSPVECFGRQPLVKSVGNSTTTPRDLRCNEDVRVVLLALADSVARRLREQGLAARCVSISVRDVDLHCFTRQHKRRDYTDITREIADEAFALFCAHYRWPKPLRSVGVSVEELAPTSQCTQTLLCRDERERVRAEALDHAVDTLKQRFGTACVHPAALLRAPELAGMNAARGYAPFSR